MAKCHCCTQKPRTGNRFYAVPDCLGALNHHFIPLASCLDCGETWLDGTMDRRRGHHGIHKVVVQCHTAITTLAPLFPKT